MIESSAAAGSHRPFWRRLPGMLTCEELEDLVITGGAGRCPRWQRVKLELHLRLCRKCRSYLAVYRRALEITGRLLEGPGVPPPPDLPESLVRAILAARASGKGPR